MMMSRPTFKLEWGAYEHEHKRRSQDWFWAMGIVTLSIAVVSVILGNVIFGVFIVIGAFALSLFLNHEPEIVNVSVSEKGITRRNVLYPYETLESFWVDVEHPHKKILLRSKKFFMPLIVVPLADDVDAERLSRLLLRHIKTEYHALPFVERLLEYLGF